MLRLILKKEDIESARTRAIVQAITEKEHAQKGWENFVSVAFPWAETAKKREIAEWAKHLANEVARGPLGVYAQPDTTYRSRLKTKILSREALSPGAADAVRRLPKSMTPILGKSG